MNFLPLLVWPSSALTSDLAVVLARPCVVMPLVWTFVSSWLALIIGVAGFCLGFMLWPYVALSCGIAPLVVVSGLQAVCHVRIMRRWSSNLEQWTIQRPRLWVPSPYSLSPARRSKPAFQ